MNKTIKRILILFIFIIALVAMLAPNKADAVTVEKSSVNTDTTFFEDGEFKSTVTVDSGLSTLKNKWYILCCQHGLAMRSRTLVFYNPTVYYKVSPSIAYLLAYMSTENDGTYKDTGQYAWWESSLGGTSLSTSGGIDQDTIDAYVSQCLEEYAAENNMTIEELESSNIYDALVQLFTDELYATINDSVSDIELSDDAYAFQSYILNALGISVDDADNLNITSSSSSYSQYFKQYTINGTSVWGYDIESNISLTTASEPTVSETQETDIDSDGSYDAEYRVGPFYLTGYSYDETYSHITNASLTVIIDGEQKTLDFGTEWWFVDSGYTDSEGNVYSYLDSEGYPTTGKFYIGLLYQVDMTSIVDLSLEYTYWNGGGCVAVYDTCHSGSSSLQTQDLACVGNGYLWSDTITVSYGSTSSYIEIEKTTIDEETGNTILYDGEFYFKLEIDKDNDGTYETEEIIVVTTTDGYGSATSSEIVWEDEDTAPKYQITEYDYDAGVWTPKKVTKTGNLKSYANDTVTVSYTNKATAKEGSLSIKKYFEDVDESVVTESFKFNVTVTGEFRYNGEHYTSDSSLELTVTLDSSNSWEYNLGTFSWIGDEAPYYEVEEVESEKSVFSWYMSSYTEGYLEDDSEIVAEFDNVPDSGTIHVDKKIVDDSEPLSGEEFEVQITITGYFIYENVEYKNQTITIATTLNESNNWSWDSSTIYFNKDNAPTYTVKETSMPDGYEYSYTLETGSNEANYENEYEGTLDGVENVQLWNTGPTDIYGYLVIDKDTNSSSLDGQSFTFSITVEGNFAYNGESYTTLTLDDIEVVAGGDPWISDVFTWDENETAPYYVVTEVTESSEVECTIENGEGYLEAESSVLVQANNELIVNGTIHVDKKIVDNSEPLSGEEFGVEVTIKGTFTYDDVGYTDETKTITVTLNESNNWSWDSSTIYFNEDNAPTYTVKETSMPDGYEYSYTLETGSNEPNYENEYEGTLDGVENVQIWNKTTNKPEYGYLVIDKDTNSSSLDGQTFTFSVTVKGNFTYNGEPYTTLTLDDIEVVAGGDPWISDAFEWDEDETAPFYEVTEVTETSGVECTIENGEGYLEAESSVLAQAYNRLINNGTIHVDKKIVDSSTPLSGEAFEVEVSIKGTFTYDDVKYTDETLTITVTLNESNNWSWDSSTIYFDEDNAPTYAVTETSMPDGYEYSYTLETGSNEPNYENEYEGTLDGVENVQIWNTTTYEPKYGYIAIDKDTTSSSLDGQTFTFSVTVTGNFTYNGESYTSLTLDGIEVVAGGSAWYSDIFTWDENVSAPKYKVTEVSTPNGVQCTISKGSGSLVNGKTITVTANNSPITVYEGYLNITKELLDTDGNELTDKTYDFYVTITASDGSVLYESTIAIKAGETWSSNKYTWDSTESAPTYTVEEINIDSTTKSTTMYVDGSQTSGTSCVGSLKEDSTVTVKAQNTVKR